MSKKVWLGLIVVIAAAIAVSLIALPKGSDWTTDSPEALAELNAAMDAKMKVYRDEAQSHLEKALELDPNFVAAKLFLANQIRYDDEDRALRLWNDVLTSDLSKLTPREVFFVNRTRAYREKRYDDVDKMIDDYLADHPNDPFVLHEKALKKWGAGDFDEAEKLNLRLIEIAPNWVIAYNQLGYIAMSSGRFVEAEEYFSSYRFVAPDQANPHDSLGELYIILGRYEEAEASLRRSIEIKPDFWNAYDHLALARLLMRDFTGAEKIHAEAKAAGEIPDYWDTGIACRIELASLVEAGLSQEILDFLEQNPQCSEGHTSNLSMLMKHKAACMTGALDIALEIEEKTEESFEAAEEVGNVDSYMILGRLNHLKGVRLAVEGDFMNAVDAFEKADQQMTYIPADEGLIKLCNRLYMVEALLASGNDGKAHKVLSKVRSVNPSMAREFEEEGLRILGLERE